MKYSIILYGISLEGEIFYYKYKDILDIQYCIDRKEQALFHGYSVFKLTEKIEDLNKHLIIVTATMSVYEEIKKELTSIGLREFENFIPCTAFGKKLAIVYGNCHMSTLALYLQQNYYFNSEYFIRFYYIGEWETPSEKELKKCDLLITQDIREKNEFNMPSYMSLVSDIKKEALVVIVPNLYGCNLFFPQCNNVDLTLNVRQHFEKEAISTDNYNDVQKQRIRVSVNSIGKRDACIDSLYLKGFSQESIVDKILNQSLYTDEEIKDNFNKQIEKLKEREEECSFKISDFIIDNYQNMQLFYEPYHPTEQIIIEKARRILQIIDVPYDEGVMLPRNLDAMEMPIYGCVKKALNMKVVQKLMRRNCATTLGNSPITIKEYVSDYIKWNWE